jgi:hypothetical protein
MRGNFAIGMRWAHAHPLMAALAAAIAWTGVGLFWASAGHAYNDFVEEWWRLFGSIDIALGVWLVLDAESHPLPSLLDGLAKSLLTPQTTRTVKWAIVAAVAIIGSGSLIALGFHVQPVVLPFMWFTCLVVCAISGVVTWHGVEILIASRQIGESRLHIFVYSPGETKELRVFARHVTQFASLCTIGYAITLCGTLLARWTASPVLVARVVTFWPLLYVPFCLLLLAYPQVQFRRVILREKQKLLDVCQTRIDDLLQKPDLSNDDVQKCNAFADFFDKIARTPDFVLDAGIVFRMVSVVVLNALTLLVPKDLLLQWLKVYAARL